jgi:hypothetical protein
VQHGHHRRHHAQAAPVQLVERVGKVSRLHAESVSRAGSR